MSVAATARSVRILTPQVPAFLALLCLLPEMGVCADAPSPTSQKAIIGEVVRVANQYIDHGPCEPSRAEPGSVATMSPHCCPSQYERLTYRHEFSVETRAHRLTLIDSKQGTPEYGLCFSDVWVSAHCRVLDRLVIIQGLALSVS